MVLFSNTDELASVRREAAVSVAVAVRGQLSFGPVRREDEELAAAGVVAVDDHPGFGPPCAAAVLMDSRAGIDLGPGHLVDLTVPPAHDRCPTAFVRTVLRPQHVVAVGDRFGDTDGAREQKIDGDW